MADNGTPEIHQNKAEEQKEESNITDSPPAVMDSKFESNKFTSNYAPANDNLDGSTVVIADCTPSQEELEKHVPESPMIDKSTKEKLKQLGQSLDSKQIHQAIGNIDMRRLWKWFSKAIWKHIEFSEGFLFLEDLKNVTKQIYAEHGIPEESVNFSYGQGNNLKIDIQKSDLTPQQKAEMRKEGEIKKTENFNKIAGIFGEEPPKEEHKTGKVFEYPDKPQDQSVPDEEIDYSHEHLEEFMRSLNEHNKNANFKQGLENPNDEPSDYGNNTLNPQQTDHLINEFLQNVSNNQKNAQNPKKESNEVLTRRAGSDILSSNPDRIMSHHTGATLSNSLAYSQSNASALGVGQFNSIGLLSGVKSRQRDPPEDDNVEKIELESEQKNEPAEEEKGNDEDDEFERSESGIIDVWSPVNEVVHHDKLNIQNKNRKRDVASYSDGMRIMNQDITPTINPALLNESNLFESQEVLLDRENKSTFKDYVETQMFLFHFNFDFEHDGMILNEDGEIPSFPFTEYKPTEDEVYYYWKYVVLACKMEKEIPLMALVYIERFMTQTGMLINHWNWRRVVLTVLLTASKVWDDDSLENIHFPQVMPDITLKEVNNLEKIFLELIDYKLHIRGAGKAFDLKSLIFWEFLQPYKISNCYLEYAKYYFILQTIANEFKNGELDIPNEGPLDMTM